MNEDPYIPGPAPDPEPDPQPAPAQEAGAPEPGPAQADAEAKAQAAPSGEVPRKRRLVKALIVLYAVSVVAAVVVLWQAQLRNAGSRGKSALDVSKVLLSKRSDYVGLVTITGPIYQGEGRRMFERGLHQWRRRIEKLAKNKDVKAIVVVINSPGGSVGAVQEIHSALLRARKEHKKPIVAQMGDTAASGGYYVAAACDKIVAHRGTLLGSIGVIFHHSNIEGLFDKLGIKSRVIKSGKMKDIGSMTRPMTEEERQLLQDLIDNAYGQFLKAVSEGRGLPEERLRPLADGRIFTGEQALEVGLVDQLGDFRDAVDLAGKLGGIEGEPKLLSETDSFANVLEFLESRAAVLLAPEWPLLREVRRLDHSGLEYRWRN
ncbi:MAG: signal peptide peptidase SppA [Elusimicrobiota bacterium]